MTLSTQMTVVKHSLYAQAQASHAPHYSDLVHQHASLVKRIAHHLLARLPDTVQLDDLIQSGMLGLFEAAKNYDATKGATFETYAGIRIRGAMLDEVRKGDWAPRSVHRNNRKVIEAMRLVEAREGRDAQDSEVAQQLGMRLEDYYSLMQDFQGHRLFSYEDMLDQGEMELTEADDKASSNLPYDSIQDAAFQLQLVEAIKQLPEREQLVLSLYYDEELNLKEIGAVLGVSESRVSQLHSQAALRLKARLKDWQ